MLPDGSINPGQMTSFNHYALGAVADWMHRRVAGLAAAEPGYRSIAVRPLFTDQLTKASAKHDTPYGEASVGWSRGDGQVTVSVTVPVGSRATVDLPGQETVEVGHGTHEWTVDDPYAAATALPADATVRQIVDDLPIWSAITAAAAESGFAADDAELARRLLPYLDQPAGDLATATGAEAVKAALTAVLHH
jgi:alpha-L-rhamnosidase